MSVTSTALPAAVRAVLRTANTRCSASIRKNWASSSSGGEKEDDWDDSPPAKTMQEKAKLRAKERGDKLQPPGPADFGNPDDE